MADKITITFPDGSSRQFPSSVTGLEIAESISKGLAREALSVTVDGEIMDLSRPIERDGSVTVNTWDTEDGKYTFWHSSAHLLAEAVQEFYPEAKFGIGPPIDRGFYYDIDFGEESVGEDDLPQIEEKMIELARRKEQYQRKKVSKEEALSYYRERDNPYKLELIQELEEGTITFYTQGAFTDLCRGPHIPHTGDIKAVKLTSVSGAYWRGDVESKQLTRIYGITFPKKKMLEAYIHQREEAKKRDHRKLGKELDIYLMDSMVGQGLPVWKPKGTVLRRQLEEFLKEELLKRGYQEVITPHIGNIKLYETSGHYPYYKDSQFPPMELEDEQYMLKPMNCPHHHRIYASELRSYRDLPIRLAEFGSVYRFEQSGELSGLSRVRGFTQDDAHIYCTRDQLKEELIDTIDLTQLVFKTFEMPVETRLSFHDPSEKDKYAGDPKMWERAEQEIREVAEDMDLDYFEATGEASFYGPKVDFIIEDAIGRKWQLGTVQVDYVMPERFDLTYMGADNEKHRPVIIHRAPFGSMERFVSILIEHFAGDFPVWLSPVQVRILPVSDDYNHYARYCHEALEKRNIRVETDDRSEKLGAKIREAETDKIPYMLIVGEKEARESTVSVRRHRKGDLGTFEFSEFISNLNKEIAEKVNPN